MADVVITVLVDILAALHEGTLTGNIYAFDSGVHPGSLNVGTGDLATPVQPGDRVLWTLEPLECEAHMELAMIHSRHHHHHFAVRPLRPEGRLHLAIDVESIEDAIPYSVELEVGHRRLRLEHNGGLSLIAATHPGGPS